MKYCLTYLSQDEDGRRPPGTSPRWTSGVSTKSKEAFLLIASCLVLFFFSLVTAYPRACLQIIHDDSSPGTHCRALWRCIFADHTKDATFVDVHDHDGSLGKDGCTWIILASFVATGGIGRSVEQLGLWSLVEGSILRIYNERCSLFNDAARK